MITEGTFKIADQEIPVANTLTTWKYLGVTFSARGLVGNSIEKDVRDLLQRTSKAPLKRQQRLVVLKFYLIPRLYQRSVLGPVAAKLLTRVDRLIRQEVRKLLRLPHDWPIGFFHAAVEESGLGIPSMRTTIPAMRVRRFEALRATDESCRKAYEQPYIRTLVSHPNAYASIEGN